MPDLKRLFSFPPSRNYVDVTHARVPGKKKKARSLKIKKSKLIVKPIIRKIKRTIKAASALRSAKNKRPKKITAPSRKPKPLKIKKPIVVAKVTHFFDKIQVAILSVKQPIKVGDTVRFKGAKTDFVQHVDSMQVDHRQVLTAKKGDEIGLKAKSIVFAGDQVLLEKDL